MKESNKKIKQKEKLGEKKDKKMEMHKMHEKKEKNTFKKKDY